MEAEERLQVQEAVAALTGPRSTEEVDMGTSVGGMQVAMKKTRKPREKKLLLGCEVGVQKEKRPRKPRAPKVVTREAAVEKVRRIRKPRVAKVVSLEAGVEKVKNPRKPRVAKVVIEGTGVETVRKQRKLRVTKANSLELGVEKVGRPRTVQVLNEKGASGNEGGLAADGEAINIGASKKRQRKRKGETQVRGEGENAEGDDGGEGAQELRLRQPVAEKKGKHSNPLLLLSQAFGCSSSACMMPWGIP